MCPKTCRFADDCFIQMPRKLAILWTRANFCDVHLKKDTGLFPLYLAKSYGLSAEIVFTESAKSTMKTDIDGVVALTKVPKKTVFEGAPSFSIFHFFRWYSFIAPYISYIKQNRNTISHYMFFHATDNSLVLAWLASRYNKNAKIWIKMDANIAAAKGLAFLFSRQRSVKHTIRQFLFKRLFKSVDLLSTESQSTYEIISNTAIKFCKNICVIPNGIKLSKLNATFSKEKVMICVGRLGSKQKNIAVLLKALETVNLKDWKIYLIGSTQIENFDFESAVQEFYKFHPEKKSCVIITGNISDKEKLNEYYRKSSVFIMPSEQESFCIAAIEAGMTGNYLLLSDFSSARDFVPNGEYGYILPESKENEQNKEVMTEKLAERIYAIVDGKIDVVSNAENRAEYFREKFSIENIVNCQTLKRWME
ncbi:MAG: glycosyltransferase [Treponema sp.]|nr:glycosyltransferase [Treponema sp.]